MEESLVHPCPYIYLLKSDIPDISEDYTESILWNFFNFDIPIRIIEIMKSTVHILCFIQSDKSTIDCSLNCVQCGGFCQVVNVADYVM